MSDSIASITLAAQKVAAAEQAAVDAKLDLDQLMADAYHQGVSETAIAKAAGLTRITVRKRREGITGKMYQGK